MENQAEEFNERIAQIIHSNLSNYSPKQHARIQHDIEYLCGQQVLDPSNIQFLELVFQNKCPDILNQYVRRIKHGKQQMDMKECIRMEITHIVQMNPQSANLEMRTTLDDSSLAFISRLSDASHGEKVKWLPIIIALSAVVVAFLPLKIDAIEIRYFLPSLGIGSTAILVILVYFELISTLNQNAMEGKKGTAVGLFIAFFVGFLIFGAGAIYFLYTKTHTAYGLHALFAGLTLWTLAGLDFVIAHYHSSYDTTRIFSYILFYIDLPCAIALTSLSLFMLLGGSGHFKVSDPNAIELFALGAITLIIFTSNIAFAFAASRLGIVLSKKLLRNAHRA